MEIVQTADGSSTVLHPVWNTLYHSKHGALQESLHVFIQYGLEALPGTLDQVHIFEMGFGTGLNALLALDWAYSNRKALRYATMELYPLPKSVWGHLHYTDLDQYRPWKIQFEAIHEAPWNDTTSIHSAFDLLKIKGSILDDSPLCKAFAPYDIVFFDAFAPKAQPELWTRVVFSAMHALLKEGGILVTYCAQGAFRRELKASGFEVKKKPGPAFKREMTIAIRK
jgi:tRNA U34 5-methylaminomethyl-2-thiouridine-forming methyltransferase MnmC